MDNEEIAKQVRMMRCVNEPAEGTPEPLVRCEGEGAARFVRRVVRVERGDSSVSAEAPQGAPPMTPEDLVALARDLKTKRNRAESRLELDAYRREMADLVPELADALEAVLKRAKDAETDAIYWELKFTEVSDPPK